MKRSAGLSRDARPLEQLSLWPAGTSEQRWAVRISERAVRMSIRILVGGRVEIVVPRGARPGMVQSFVHRHRAWAERRAREFSLRHSPDTDAIPEHIELAACGEHWSVKRGSASGHAALRGFDNGMLLLAGAAESSAKFCGLLQDWLLQRARAVLAPQLAQLADESGLTYRQLQIRRQRTRWGSCSPTGTISLNCCLLFQPAAVVRYLLLHELCHTRHMNHSRRFWQLVERHEPDFRRLDRALTRGWQNVPTWVFAS
jgi:predicted metal-dependent hydrolase